jgi:hypothetical protein
LSLSKEADIVYMQVELFGNKALCSGCQIDKRLPLLERLEDSSLKSKLLRTLDVRKDHFDIRTLQIVFKLSYNRVIGKWLSSFSPIRLKRTLR